MAHYHIVDDTDPAMPVDFLVLHQLADIFATFPHLPTLLHMAAYALIDRISYLKELDIAAPINTDYDSALTVLHDQYPELRNFISSPARRPYVKQTKQICQLAADLFTWAATTYPHEEE